MTTWHGTRKAQDCECLQLRISSSQKSVIPAASVLLPTGCEISKLHMNSFKTTQVWTETEASLLSTILPLLYMLHCKHWTIWVFISFVAHSKPWINTGPCYTEQYLSQADVWCWRNPFFVSYTHIHSVQDASIFIWHYKMSLLHNVTTQKLLCSCIVAECSFILFE